MNTAAHVIKCVGAWGFVIAATVCLFVAPNLTIPCAAVGIGFCWLPEA